MNELPKLSVSFPVCLNFVAVEQHGDDNERKTRYTDTNSDGDRVICNK